MLQHRDDDEVEDELDDGDDNEVSSDEEVYYQTVAVGGRSGRRGVGGGATLWTLELSTCNCFTYCYNSHNQGIYGMTWTMSSSCQV